MSGTGTTAQFGLQLRDVTFVLGGIPRLPGNQALGNTRYDTRRVCLHHWINPTRKAVKIKKPQLPTATFSHTSYANALPWLCDSLCIRSDASSDVSTTE